VLGAAGAALVMPSVAALRADGAAAQEATPEPGGGFDAYRDTIVTATDFAFGLPATIPGGWNRLTLRNAGEMDHHAMVMALNPGVTWEDYLAASDRSMADFDPSKGANLGELLAVAASYGGPGSVGPDEESTAVLYLPPGEYAVICAIPGPEGKPHYALGMQSRLTVTDVPADAPADPPVASGTIGLGEFLFVDLPDAVPAGPQVWQVNNIGAQLHELVVYRLSEGVAYQDALDMIAAGPDAAAAPAGATPMAGMDEATPMAGGAPFTALAGIAPMNPGASNWTQVDLAPGDYFAICFIPDVASGMPHFALGMAQPFTVS